MKYSSTTKYRGLTITIIMLLLCAVFVLDSMAAQGQILLNGRVKSIDLSSNAVVVADYEGKDFKLSIEDQETIGKFKDGRIKVGEDVNVKYRIKDGKNIPFSLRKLAGC